MHNFNIYLIEIYFDKNMEKIITTTITNKHCTNNFIRLMYKSR